MFSARGLHDLLRLVRGLLQEREELRREQVLRPGTRNRLHARKAGAKKDVSGTVWKPKKCLNQASAPLRV